MASATSLYEIFKSLSNIKYSTLNLLVLAATVYSLPMLLPLFVLFWRFDGFLFGDLGQKVGDLVIKGRVLSPFMRLFVGGDLSKAVLMAGISL